MSDKTLFQQLYDINVNDKLEKKAYLSYLTWACAWAEVKKIDPNVSAEIHEFPLPNVEGIKVPYLQTPTGYFVKVSVTIKGQTERGTRIAQGVIAPVKTASFVEVDGQRGENGFGSIGVK